LIDFGRENVMQNIISGSLAFLCFRQSRNNEKWTFFISKTIVGKDAISSLDTCSVFPLYIYPPINVQQTIDGYQERTPNLNLEIVQKIAKNIGLAFIPEKDISAGSTVKGTFAPIDILDYIYAVLHSPTYREKYKEFLKIDFPRIPYPENAQIFWQLVELGGELRQIHLLESPKLKQYITTYLKDGDNHITRKITPKDWELYDTENNLGRVHINNGQYFDPIPLTVWEFYIGGYQPAQKWLKDRRGRTLSYDDVLHYQKIIAALTETDRIMKQIDSVWLVG
jgi:predicted helicase